MPELLELTHKNLGWPSKNDIMNPKGVGPNVLANLAKRKLETAINQLGVEVEVGILAANPDSDKTEDPLAIVCEFNSEISQDKLRTVQRLAWSFSRSPMLITVEPTLLRVWTCWKKPPEEKKPLNKLLVQEYSPSETNLFDGDSLSNQAAKSLQWIEFVSGNFFQKHSSYFRRNQRADQLMLNDLKCLREKLLKKNLPQDICHDLIARIIFIEFLFQRKDSKGNAALNESVLESLHENGILSKVHKDFASILKNRKETYQFFRELNERFNGDLFPGKGTPDEREAEWKAEMDEVKASHLNLLAEFVNGKLEISTGQYCLWKRYAFNVIPLEFISSIYEEFTSTKEKNKSDNKDGQENSGVHYTPGHLVDFILDEVLPWNSKKWDLKILDPACGSGIFLVKAYQRLVNRYKNAHGKSKPRIEDLRNLLKNNLFGIDIKRDAVRVASFSLYLAMCDEIEPKLIWPKNVRFPPLRDKTLVESDFFAEDKKGFSTEKDNGTYDLVIGNAPWARGSGDDSKYAQQWANRDFKDVWDIPNFNIGPLFLAKAAILTKRSGRIVMLQPANTMLSNQDSTAKKFRSKFFCKYKVDKIVNLSALRFVLFSKANSPACIVTMRPTPPDNEPIIYVFPKRSHTKEDRYRIIIEHSDINEVYPNEAAQDRLVWTALAWGGRRDLSNMRKLAQMNNLEQFEKEEAVKTRRGIGRGKRVERQEDILNMPLLDSKKFPKGTIVHLDAAQLKLNDDPFLYEGHSKDLSAFKLPQMVFKLSWRKDEGGRFRAAMVKSSKKLGPVICSVGYVSVHQPEKQDILESACLGLNSIVAVYYALLSSGQLAFYIPKPNKEDLLKVPIPPCQPDILKKIKTIEDVDQYVRKVFGFKDAEWVLIEDLFDYTLKDFMGGINSPGRQPTRKNGNEDVLQEYCQYFRRVLKAGFGEDKNISATIFTESEDSSLPVRLIAIHLGSPKDARIKPEPINCPDLLDRLKELDKKYLDSEDKRKGGIFYRRVARIYDTMEIAGRKVPTIYLVKPDKVRYWTRSMALRDADEVAADIMLWENEALINITQMQRGKIWRRKRHTQKDAGRIRQNLHHS